MRSIMPHCQCLTRELWWGVIAPGGKSLPLTQPQSTSYFSQARIQHYWLDMDQPPFDPAGDTGIQCLEPYRDSVLHRVFPGN